MRWNHTYEVTVSMAIVGLPVLAIYLPVNWKITCMMTS